MSLGAEMRPGSHQHNFINYAAGFGGSELSIRYSLSVLPLRLLTKTVILIINLAHFYVASNCECENLPGMESLKVSSL